MQIFCDESGGCASSEPCFVTVGVALGPSAARLVIRRFRKTVRLKGEIHGHALTGEQRAVFFEQLAKRAESLAVAVVCERADMIGGWAMRTLEEHVLHAEMVAEGCMMLAATELLSTHAGRRMHVIQDGGRYKRALLEEVRGIVARTLQERLPGIDLQVDHGDSMAVAGLQVADVIANTVRRSLKDGGDGLSGNEPLAGMARAGRLHVRKIELRSRRPTWVVAA